MTIGLLEFLGFKKKKKKDESSKNVAKERLQFILVQDRIKLSPSEMESLKKDLLKVMKKYVDVDDQEIEMEINREEQMMAMVANFPLRRNNQ
ncbi:MAG TPA: cell division topological specificity factor MinE [Halanaerobiales bacterium]|nr:cell division topological specificity factor MinE [Halanaerobiales bacterium]